MKRIRWAAAAADDLEAIHDYLQKHYPASTKSTIHRLYDAARSLRRMPYRGRTGVTEGTRELVLAPLPYIIVYAVEQDVIHVFRVLHAAQDWQ
ncbi:MAG: type II toxin-antitoxin system mRNA interferase toxin, RelE/StbE family [Terriglobia bacterium]|nr:MAG: type II toxin-antitoxin system mRNA interferase toxin, RelE/StbE family [Terriglobia bacterium]